jgi:Ca2+-transporting ATPase
VLEPKGHVVVVTGDGINDAPALKQAHLGLSMGVHGTEMAKQSSDIVILDDDFESVVAVLKWGRCVCNNIQNFLHFQLTVIVVVFVVNIVAAVNSIKLPLTALQLLWVNVIKDILGSLALATKKPCSDLMAKPPVDRSWPLIARIMCRNLVGQVLYQVTILLALFGGDEKVNNTLFFNTFVLCQVFNAFNARKVEKKNIFKGLLKNKAFLGIIGITVILQMIMEGRLDWRQWGACIGLAALSWPIGWLVKCIPVSRNLG